MGNKEYKEFDDNTTKYGEQLELFSLEDIIFCSKRNDYSTTVDLYDLMPKYYLGKLEEIRNNGYLPVLERYFTFKKQNLLLSVSPALIVQKDGSSKAFYPSIREEIIEDVLRKLAMNKDRNGFLDERLTVKFTLYELWKELKRVKHEYNYSDIRESLNILSKTNIEVKTLNEKITFSSNMFETFGVVDDNDKDLDDFIEDSNYNKKVMYYVRFNSLVSDAVKNGDWRILNYYMCLKYKRSLSRWLFKRMSNYFFYNEHNKCYNISLSNILKESSIKDYESTGENIRQVKRALEEMVSQGSVITFGIKKKISKERANKIEDAIFDIYPSKSFLEDLKLNYIKDEVKNKITKQEKKEVKNTKLKEKDYKKEQKQIKDLLSDNNIKFIDNDILNISNFLIEKSFNEIKDNILSAIEYGKSLERKSKDYNIMAIIFTAIKQNWKNSSSIEVNDNFNKKNNIEDTIDKIKNENFREINKKFLENFGEDVYRAWFSDLDLLKLNKSGIIISAPTNFVKDWIKKEFFDGVYKKINGKKVCIRKGLKELIKEVLPKLKSIDIVRKEQ